MIRVGANGAVQFACFGAPTVKVDGSWLISRGSVRMSLGFGV
jgi:hypothetical protein